MATADEVVVVLRADTNQYVANLTNAEAAFRDKLKQMEATAVKTGAAFTRVGAAAGKTFPRIAQDAKQAGTAIQSTTTPVGNLAAQIQDIGVQLASGQSPFLILAQQLPQITQHGGQLGGVMGALRQTVTSLISPLGLVTTAFTLVSAGAIAYFSHLLSDGEDAELTLEQQEKLIAKIAERWGDAVPELKAYADERERLADIADLESGEGILRRDQYSDLLPVIRSLSKELDQLPRTGNYGEIYDKFERLAKRVEEGTATVKDLEAAVLAARTMFINQGAPAADAFASSLDNIKDRLKAISEAADEAGRKLRAALPREETPFYDPRDPRYTPAGILPRTAPVPGMLSPGDVGPLDFKRSFDESLDDAADAIDGFVQRVIKVESGGDATARNKYSSATGVGQFIETTWLDLFRKYYPEQAQNMGKDAILALRTDADISASLIRRYAQENARILQAAGVHVDEAALQLSHFLGPGDAAKVLNAASGTPLQGLIRQASINANPTILGGGRTVDDAIAYAQRRASGSSSGSTRKTPAELFEGNIDQVQKRIDILNAELEATKGLTAGTDEYALAVEKARIEAQLLADAKAHDLEITPELAARISTLAENYAKAAVGARGLKQETKDLARAEQEAAEFGKDVLGGFIKDLAAGKSGAEALANALEKVADKLLNLALDALFSTSGGVGSNPIVSILGALFGGVGKRAGGGPVRAGHPYIVGERRPELFVPDQNGTIIPRVPTASGMGRGAGSVEIIVKSVRGEMFDQIVDTRAQGVSMSVTRQGIGAYDKQLTNTLGNRMQRAGQRQT